MYKIPILILTYNRPNKFLMVLKSLDKIQPYKIYISCDGPKNTNDINNIKKINENIKNINWKTKVYKNFLNKNMGPRLGVQNGLNWFFKNEKMGIILEDDNLPSKSFFKFCEELLIKYQNNKKIYAISGFNFKGRTNFGDGDYFISKYFLTWGWATWRRVWNSSNKKLDYWPTWKRNRTLDKIHNNKLEVRYWAKFIKKYYDGSIIGYDIPFLASMWKDKSFCILPNLNMIKNIGFDYDATYGFNKKYSTPKSINFNRNLKHPLILKTNNAADKIILNEFLRYKNLLYPWRLLYIFKLIIFNPKYVMDKLIRKLK